MNWGIVKAVFIKDLQETTKNRYVFLSILVLPVIIVFENVLAVSQMVGQNVDTATILQIIPYSSLIVLFIPAIITALLASTSVVIEKNNRSLEPLLSTPITDAELLMGKCLAAFIPAMVVTYGTIILLIGIIDVITIGALGYLLLPTPDMIYQMILVPLIGMLGTFISLLVSTKIKDVRAAQQVSTFAVLPLLIFAVLITGVFTIDLTYKIIAVIVLTIFVFFFARVTIKRFRREAILISWS
jgi:ABC-2 type transport system permease protein